MKIVVTGATGYIGLRLLAAMRTAGLQAVVAGRRPVPGVACVPFDLRAPDLAAWPRDAGAVVHLAALTGNVPGDAAPPDEVAGARAIVAWCSDVGIPLLFVSSQTARQDAPTDYGRTKWAIEQCVLAAGGIALRPGLVYGGKAGGLFGVLVRTVRSLPVLPAFIPAPQVQPVHVDDLALSICVALRRTDLRGRVLCVAQDATVSFTRFLQLIASNWCGAGRLFVPVPSLLVQVANRLTGGRAASVDRLVSLIELRPMQTTATLEALGLGLRRLDAGLVRERRQLLLEGVAMTRHVAGRLSLQAARRYARALAQLRQGAPLAVPAWVWRLGLVALLDGAAPASEFSWRLDCATALVEAAPAGAQIFLQQQRRPGWRTALQFSLLVLREVLRRMAALALAPLVRRWRK